MPQKKNPDVPELVRGKCGRVFGHLQGLLTMIKGLPLAYNKDFQEDKEALFDVVSTGSQCLEAMTILIEEGLSFREDRLEAAVASDFSNATDVADYLVARQVPFREAYQIVGSVVKQCLSEGSVAARLRARIAGSSSTQRSNPTSMKHWLLVRLWLHAEVKVEQVLIVWRNSCQSGVSGSDLANG